MAGYQADPAGLGVGKTYGPRSLGDVNGTVRTAGFEKQVVFEFTSGTSDAVYTVELPSYYLVDDLYLEVEEAFAATSSADLDIDGGAGLTTDLDLTSLGLAQYALTGLANTTGDADGATLTLTLDAAAKASATGKARVVVVYKKI